MFIYYKHTCTNFMFYKNSLFLYELEKSRYITHYMTNYYHVIIIFFSSRSLYGCVSTVWWRWFLQLYGLVNNARVSASSNFFLAVQKNEQACRRFHMFFFWNFHGSLCFIPRSCGREKFLSTCTRYGSSFKKVFSSEKEKRRKYESMNFE